MTWLQRLSAAVGVASWSRAILFALSLATAAAAAAFWLGSDWQVGRAARSELKSIQELLDAREEQSDEIRALREAFAKLRSEQADANRERWARIADWLATPGVGDQPALDARGIQLWNAANAGSAGGAAGAGAAVAVPGGAAAQPGRSDGGDRQGAAEEPQRGDGAGD